uniref:Proteinase inhibitor n=2 Tax=Linum usitatissimum TaxID=4006 RepID=ICI_LINUS|nr:RecName: Full=Proteinase inhibitor; AltName: Full=LUTI [Linum usitatissimum]
SRRCPGKNAWPELVGKSGNMAAATVERENRNVHAIVLKEGSAMTKDFRCDRVWVIVNDHGVVTSVPHIT